MRCNVDFGLRQATGKNLMVVALTALKTHRPAADDMKGFLVAVMENPSKMDFSEFKKADDSSEGVYTYLKTSGVFTLLKPAMLALDNHRPDRPREFIAEFLKTMTAHLA